MSFYLYNNKYLFSFQILMLFLISFTSFTLNKQVCFHNCIESKRKLFPWNYVCTMGNIIDRMGRLHLCFVENNELLGELNFSSNLE